MSLRPVFTLLVLALLLGACRPARVASPTSAPGGATMTATATEALPATAASTTAAPQASVTATASRTPRPTATTEPTITLTPTPTGTPTPDPAIYDPKLFGDVRELDSYVVSYARQTTGPNYRDDQQLTAECIRSPAQLHETFKGTSQNYSSWDDKYRLGDWSYRKDNLTGLWAVTNLAAPDAPANAFGQTWCSQDLRVVPSISYFKTAHYVGEEEYNGLLAFHYTFDQTNLATLQNIQIDQAEGELFISSEGRHPLHSHARFSGKLISGPDGFTQGVLEVTQDLVSFNQSVVITLPADYPNLDLGLDLPLPPDAILYGAVQSKPGTKTYTYVTSITADDFKAFYTDLAPTNGWSAAELVDLHGPTLFCAGCASLSKDGQHVIVEYRTRELSFTKTIFVINVYFGQ